MRMMITDLLDLTRIESGQKKRFIEPVDLLPIATAALDAVRISADERGIHLDLDAPDELIIAADASEMEIVFNNLISNAVKYNRDQGRVDVILSRKDDEVLIIVKDTGIGMTADEAAKLFGEFVRIKNDKTRTISGTGLGLSIVKKIAALYNGSASVESESDKGSVFRVRLIDASVRAIDDPVGAADHSDATTVSGRLSSVGIISDIKKSNGTELAIGGEQT